jgi:archaellum biogenesis protein FlaJ (TadC family)
MMIKLRRDVLAVTAIAGFALAAQVSAQPAEPTVYTMTPERMAAATAALAGLISAIVGTLAVARTANGDGRRAARVALVLGPIGLALGGLVVAMADGGVGTGNGLAGGVVAMAVGLIGMALGGIAWVRSRRTC